MFKCIFLSKQVIKCVLGPTYISVGRKLQGTVGEGHGKKSDMVREEEAGIIFCQMRRDKCVAPQTPFTCSRGKFQPTKFMTVENEGILAITRS